jgi:hypothetical protein
MLTLAEEIGLAGLALTSRVRHALHRLPPTALAAGVEAMRSAAVVRHLVYLHEGELDPIRILPCPLAVLPDQLAYAHTTSLALLNALKRLPELYFTDAEVRAVLELPEAEEAWLRECWGPAQHEANPVFGRLDALVDFTTPMWKESLQFIEPNLTGIGGLHMVPTCERILVDTLLPLLKEVDPELSLEPGRDIRELLMQEFADHLEVIGRPGGNVCFIEPKYADAGPDEQAVLARYFHEQHGMRIMHADPAELVLQDGEVWYEGARVDLGYRDYGVPDLLELAAEGADVEPMRTLFKQNRMISSIGAELDQKSCFEVFTDPALAERHFSSEERDVFRHHVLWTRLVRDRRTALPDGHEGDLLPHVCREHERYVLKPNRAYGGEGVVIGYAVTRAEWERAVEAALDDAERWVVQRVAPIPAYDFPVVLPDGSVRPEPFYTVMGFAPTRYGVAILARASQKQVVNVAQRGGMCAVLVGHPPGALHGPNL